MFKHTVSTCYTSEYTKDIIHTSSPPVPTYYSHGHTGALLSDRGTPCLPLLLSCCCDHKAQVRVPSWVSVPLVSSLPPSSTLPNEGRALCSRGACSQQPGQKAWPPATWLLEQPSWLCPGSCPHCALQEELPYSNSELDSWSVEIYISTVSGFRCFQRQGPVSAPKLEY